MIKEVKQDVEGKIKETSKNTKEQKISVTIAENKDGDVTECINRLSSLNLTQMKSMGGYTQITVPLSPMSVYL